MKATENRINKSLNELKHVLAKSASYVDEPSYRQVDAQRFYHGTTLDRAQSILAQGPSGREFYVTPEPRIAKYFAIMKQPWFGSVQQRTLAILELTPITDTLIVAEPKITLPPLGAGTLVAQYPNTAHYRQADLAWNPQHEYQFLTSRGREQFRIRLPEENIHEPACLRFNVFETCIK